MDEARQRERRVQDASGTNQHDGRAPAEAVAADASSADGRDGAAALPPLDAAVPADGRAMLDKLLKECARHGASDLHVSAGLPPYFRTHGVLEPRGSHKTVTQGEMESLVDALVEGHDASGLSRTGSVDGAVSSSDGVRYRFNVFRRQGELAVALRKLEDSFRSLRELGLPESLYRLAELPDGLCVFVGPTGAGKSTTLATLVDRINRTRRSHIVTIEDPVEYVHRPIKSLINQRQIGRDASGFNEALVASLRQDPDVILVGEIRDLNTIRTAITAAETGHLVFTTVHSSDCVSAVERLVSVFPSSEQEGIRRQLSLVLRAIVTQHLLLADGEGERSAADAGRKRVACSEVLFLTPAVANLIATAKSAQIYSAMESGTAQGMQTLEQDLARLLVGNVISERTAVAVSKSPDILRDRVGLLRRGVGTNASRPPASSAGGTRGGVMGGRR